MFREPLGAHALDQIFRAARTYPGWLDREVTDAQLRELYELLKWGPTTIEHMPLLAPHNPNARAALEAKTDNETTALRNGALQGGYLIVAARALGLDCGPMAGFDHDKVNAAFWAGTSVKTNFLCNLGYGDPAQVKPRAARLSFDEACRII